MRAILGFPNNFFNKTLGICQFAKFDGRESMMRVPTVLYVHKTLVEDGRARTFEVRIRDAWMKILMSTTLSLDIARRLLTRHEYVDLQARSCGLYQLSGWKSKNAA